VTRQFNLADLFELVAAEAPDRLAVVAGERRLTFRDLDARTNQVGRWLLDHADPGAKVAIYSWNRAEWVEAFLGAFKARMVPVNLNYRYTGAELRYVIDNADAEIVVVERGFLPVLTEILAELPSVAHVLVLDDGTGPDSGVGVDYEQALAGVSSAPLDIDRSPDDLYMLFTGGTTGMPKGVMWRHEDIYFAAMSGMKQDALESPEAIKGRVFPDELVLSSFVGAPLMHGAAQWGLMSILLMGGTTVLYSAHGFDPVEVWQIVGRERCSGISLVGDAMARPLADALAGGIDADLSNLKMISSGGAVLSPAVKDELRAHLPNVGINDSFGASELGASGSNTGSDARRFVVTPEMNVLDDDLRPVVPGSGTIGRVARTGHIPLGYYKDEAKTAATFVTDPEGHRWAVPGDFGTVEADGTIQLLGRGSQCINTGGEKVYPEEVEEALKSHPAVFDALVVGVPDERFTERIAAVVSLRPGTTVALEDLAAHCRQTLAGYKLPRQLTVVDVVRRTPAGKADYRWAKETAAQG